MVPRVRYYSLLDGTGYGNAAFAYMECLLDAGVEIMWSPCVQTNVGLLPWEQLPEAIRPTLDNGSARRKRLLKTMEQALEYDIVFMHILPEMFPRAAEAAKRNIAYTVWETDCLPNHWPELIRAADHIVVPCEFNRKLFSLSPGPGVSVIPHIADSHKAFDGTLHDPELGNVFRRDYGIEAETYVFYSISAWAPRKDVAKTLHAYQQAFDGSDDVCLVFKTDNMGYDYSGSEGGGKRPTLEMVAEIAEQYPNPARILVVDECIDDIAMKSLHLMADCYFSLTHSEGWGLGAFDAATHGNPVIITGWGGQLDYLPRDSAYLVDYELIFVEPVIGWESFTSNQRWASADMKHAIRLLRYARNHVDESKRKGEALADYIRRNFPRESICSQLMGLLKGDGS